MKRKYIFANRNSDADAAYCILQSRIVNELKGEPIDFKETYFMEEDGTVIMRKGYDAIEIFGNNESIIKMKIRLEDLVSGLKLEEDKYG